MTDQRETDDEFDRISSQFLSDVREIGRLEEEKRLTGRSTLEFLALTEEIEERSRRLYRSAMSQREAGERDSADAEESADRGAEDSTG